MDRRTARQVVQRLRAALEVGADQIAILLNNCAVKLLDRGEVSDGRADDWLNRAAGPVIDPRDAAIVFGVVRWAQASRLRHQRGPCRVAGVAVVVVAVVDGGIAVLGGDDEPVAQPPQEVQPTSTPSVDTSAQEEAAELARKLAALEAERQASAAAVANKLELIERKVAGPGVVVQRLSGAVHVLFAEGLFSAGTEFGPDRQDALVALGKRLPGLDAAITVTGYSVVVPGSSTSGGSRTALLRARTATQELSAASGLPPTAFAMQSGDQGRPPFRNAAQNRTVTLTLTPR
ncbi:hypothetical protein E0H75_28210 [Kribbella capetownensis]|uniref:OmpA-like domain-containing protein n=1 Tax=Kribbella capetownensis TaxID=1572659 RepID=A0A4R0JGJ9_9ACTN|nr:hypothetical protein [Kribbella capetownensis]TCC45619.1 hypothetical protein E0H75_28210 [Kribbella capetownensis]